jgi:hypothetical protein
LLELLTEEHWKQLATVIQPYFEAGQGLPADLKMLFTGASRLADLVASCSRSLAYAYEIVL